MRIRFLGTRGEIEARTARHGMHSAFLLLHKRRRIMVECGADWQGRLGEVRPHAIVISHAHPDHAWGIRAGAPCPVYASPLAWMDLWKYPVADKRVVQPREPVEIEGVTFEAFPVEHSTRCPAVGYRITAGGASLFYSGDVVYIYERAAALSGVGLYIGDGATLSRSLVRKRADRLVGHAAIKTQLGWCRKSGIPRAIFTHVGSRIVEADDRSVEEAISRLGVEHGVKAGAAFDGMEIRVG